MVETQARIVPICELAQGGMGRVDLVARREGSFERLYARKRLHRHLAADAQCHAMFLDEARIAGLIRHANVVSVIDVGEDTEGPYLLMDYVEGVPLNAVISHAIDSGSPLPMAMCLEIATQVARGLHAAHELTSRDGDRLGVVHRDVSPQNILVGFDGIVRLTDFGIAKALDQSSHTSTGILKGKVGYLAPEQLRFEPVDRRADLFALGVVLYELLAGKRLHPAGDRSETARHVLDDAAPDIGNEREETPPEVVELLFQMMSKDPALRPVSAREVSRRLEAAKAELDEPAGATLVEYMESSFSDRRLANQKHVRDAAQNLQMTEPDVARLVTEMSATSRATPAPAPWRWLAPTTIAGVVALIVVVGRFGAEPSAPQSSSGVPSPAAPSRTRTVSVHVETTPSGAEILMNGTLEGTTPRELVLPASQDALTLTLRLAGHRERVERVVPDVNQRLVLPLVPSAPADVPRPRAPLAGSAMRPKPDGLESPKAAPPPVPSASAPSAGFRRYD